MAKRGADDGPQMTANGSSRGLRSVVSLRLSVLALKTSP